MQLLKRERIARQVDNGPASCFFQGLLLALLSGSAALSHELLWTRRLADVLGSGHRATAAVLGCFFFGLALGSAWATRLTAAPRRPWLSIAYIEFGIALATVPALTLAQWTGWIWPTLGTAGLVAWQGTLVKLVLPVLVVIPPSFLMGMTLPLLVAAVVRRQGSLSRQGVWLYAANTLGGVIGLLVTAGLTLQWLGVAGAMSWALAINLIVAIGCLAMHQAAARAEGDGAALSTDVPRTGSPSRPREMTAGALPTRSSSDAGKAAVQESSRTTFLTSIVISFLSGTGVLAMEILALNLVFNVWPASLYSTTAVLATVIVILALAAWATPVLVSRFGSARRLLAAVVAMTAITTVLAPIAFVRLTGDMAYPGETSGVMSFVMVVVARVLTTVGPALMMAGLVLPLTFSWYGSEGNDRGGRRWGWLLAANGFGGLTGAMVANGLLMPWLGMHNGFTAIALLYAVLAVGLSGVLGATTGTWVVTCFAMAFSAVAGSMWVRSLPLMTPGGQFRIVDIRCGREGVVAVVDQVAPRLTWRRSIVQANQFVLGGLGASHSQRRKMLLPLLLHASPDQVATIGLATGITAGAALDYEPVQSLTAIEISPLITAAAAQFFTESNRDICTDRRAEVVVEDGRTYLAASRAVYDVVVGDLFRPWISGVGRLYSREHFQAVRWALRPGGMFCQWLPMYQLEEPQFEVILTTFLQVFPNTHLITGSFSSTKPSIGLVGFRDGDIDWTGLATRCHVLRQSDHVRDPSLRRFEGACMYYLGSATVADSTSPIINTLNNAWIEIDAGRSHVSQATREAYLQESLWIRFDTSLRKRFRRVENVPTEVTRWSALGRRIGWLHLARRRRVPEADALKEAINEALPADFYDDAGANWKAWPIPRDGTVVE